MIDRPKSIGQAWRIMIQLDNNVTTMGEVIVRLQRQLLAAERQLLAAETRTLDLTEGMLELVDKSNK
jgi:hypothetical protein